MISSLLDDTIIFAYCPSTAHPHHMLLLQRSIQPIFPTKDDNNVVVDDDDNEEEDEEKDDKNVEAKANKDADDDSSNNNQKGNSYQRIKIMDEWQKLLNFNLTG